MLRLTSFVLVATLAAMPIHAKTFVCEIQEQGSSGWIPEVVAVAFDADSGQVAVLDPVINYYKDGAISGRVATKNAKRITFAWTLDKITAKGGGRSQFTSGIRYRLTIQNSSLKATIWAEPNGYSNQFRGKGQCTVE